MQIAITTTHRPATDLGYLLVKNPGRAQQFTLNGGVAHVYYPEANDERCTVVMVLDLNPIELVRGRETSQTGGTLSDYVNDRPYVGSSFLAVALRNVFGTAMSGKSKDRPELAITPIPLTCTISALPCRRGPNLIHELFEPLGYTVSTEGYKLDPAHPEWGESDYYTVSISGTVTLQLLLMHLFILVPVLDSDKHYFVGDAEVEKLVRHGAGWLATHPLRDLIARRYVGHKDHLAARAITALEAERQETEEPEDPEVEGEESDGEQAENGEQCAQGTGPNTKAQPEIEIERRLSLHDQRHQAVIAVLRENAVTSVIDMGCGGGKFLKVAAQEEQLTRILGFEVSCWSLNKARYALKLHKARKLPPEQRDRIRLIQGSVTYRDSVLQRERFDAAVSIEVIEHVEPEKLDMFATVLFGDTHPNLIVLTTPNVEYNCRFPGMEPGQLRHKDHRFEWTRAEFQSWCETMGARFGYSVEFRPIGPVDEEVGAPSQMAVFRNLLTEEERAQLQIPNEVELPSVEALLAGQYITTTLVPRVKVHKEHAGPAFETINRHAVDPRWLVYLPPTMSPSETSPEGDHLEYPTQAFDYFRRHGVRQVVCEQKHMGSRAVVIVCRDQETARRRFGINEAAGGIVYSRMGRRFFNDYALETAFLDRVRQAVTASGLWEELNTDWVALDSELMPWSAKAQDLIRKMYASTGAAANISLPIALASAREGLARGLQLQGLVEQLEKRWQCAQAFRTAYRQYCWSVATLDDYQLAPFHLLASEGAMHFDKDHVWHMETLKRVAACSNGLVIATPYHVVDVDDQDQRLQVTRWWEALTGAGGEGMVVKPLSFIATEDGGRLVQPAIKCRGREYLRIIYGPDYTLPHHLERLRGRGLHSKRSLAAREFALGHESLQRFVNRQSLASVHECAFAVLGLETETCDPRL